MNRSAGILLSVTSLPSRYGVGCLDSVAFRFVDCLAEAGQTYWQILPLGPTGFGESGDSPYQSFSAFAGNPYLISLEKLVEEGVLTCEECDAAGFGPDGENVNYETLNNNRLALLHLAYERSNISENPHYRQFLAENHWWLTDYALFMALRGFFQKPWTQWPEDIRKRWDYSLDYYHRTMYYDVEFQKFLQFKFFEHWWALKNYAASRNIQIIGDMPIYVAMNSADVWAHPELFQLNEDGSPSAVSGCPPDAFSATGQIWGNPLYRWDYHRSTGFDWWCSRLWHSFHLYDVVRIDHFRGFDQYYSIPSHSSSAQEGHWEPGPGIDLFRTMEWRMGWRPVIAEDLGLMTDTVRQLVRESGFPNMKVLQFGFDLKDTGAANDYLPHNYGTNCVVYTGTHDNETIAGWFLDGSEELKRLVRDYLGDVCTPDDQMYLPLVAMAMRSRGDICIIPLQDYLGLDNSARMNRPSFAQGNWAWRLTEKDLSSSLFRRILRLTQITARFNWANAHLV